MLCDLMGQLWDVMELLGQLWDIIGHYGAVLGCYRTLSGS